MRIALKTKTSNKIRVGDIVRVKHTTMSHPTGGPPSYYVDAVGVVTSTTRSQGWDLRVSFSSEGNHTVDFMWDEIEKVTSG